MPSGVPPVLEAPGVVPGPLHEALFSQKSSHSCRHFAPGLTASQSWASASPTSQKEGSPGFSVRGAYLNLSPLRDPRGWGPQELCPAQRSQRGTRLQEGPSARSPLQSTCPHSLAGAPARSPTCTPISWGWGTPRHRPTVPADPGPLCTPGTTTPSLSPACTA